MSVYKGRRFVVTGGAGFIGSHISDRILRLGGSVCVLDDLSNGCLSNLDTWKGNDKLEFVNTDIRNRKETRNCLEDVDTVFHEAAKVSVPMSIKDPCLVMDVNVMGTTILLDECRRMDVSKVIMASSSSVYGDKPVLPKIESMTLNPISPYGASKLAAEKAAIAFCSTYGIHVTALRYFNVYGPRQRGGAYAGVISIFISQAIKGNDLPIYDDGQQTRDFTYIDDVVECNLLACTSMMSKGNVYNVGGGSQITIENLADEIIDLTESSSKKKFLPARSGDVRDSLAGLEKAESDLGYAPKVDIREGLRETIAWVVNG